MIEAVIQGMLLGGHYAILAAGLSLMFGVMRIINLAHGDLAILGAYAVLMLDQHLGFSPWWALVWCCRRWRCWAWRCSAGCLRAPCAPASCCRCW